MGDSQFRRRSLLQFENSTSVDELTRGAQQLGARLGTASAREIAETNGLLLKRLGRQFVNRDRLRLNQRVSATGKSGSQPGGAPYRRRWLAESQPVTQASSVSQATVALPGGLKDCCKANPDCTDQLSVIVTHIDYSAAIQGLAELKLLGLGSVRVVSSMVSVRFTSSAGTPVGLSCADHPFQVTVPLQSQLFVPGAPGTTECWELQQNGTSLTGTTSQQTTLVSVVGGVATCAPTNAGETSQTARSACRDFPDDPFLLLVSEFFPLMDQILFTFLLPACRSVLKVLEPNVLFDHVFPLCIMSFSRTQRGTIWPRKFALVSSRGIPWPKITA